MKGNKILYQLLSIVLALYLFSGCGLPASQPNSPLTYTLSPFVTFESVFPDTGVTITFHHPRNWHIGYFSDSGYSGWSISDVDPNSAFWNRNRTGEEMVVIMMVGQIDNKDTNPIELMEEWPGLEIDNEIVELEVDGRKIAYKIALGRVQGAVVKNQVGGILSGDYPIEKEEDYKEGLEKIFNTLNWEEFEDLDITNNFFGTRLEDQLFPGAMVEGYVPIWSISQWSFDGVKGMDISITVEIQELDVPQVDEEVKDTLMIDVLNEKGSSILTSGQSSFTNKHEIRGLRLSNTGTYTIQLHAPPNIEMPWYGWYQIALE